MRLQVQNQHLTEVVDLVKKSANTDTVFIASLSPLMEATDGILKH
jgi:hypothetical protein